MSHIDLSEHPAYKAMLRMDGEAAKAVAAAGLDPLLAELVKIRISQLNGCAFCLRTHTRDALQMGETTDRLSVVAAWWESQYFTGQEQAALGLAEEITRLSVPERADWDDGSLNDEQVAAIRSHYPVGPDSE